MELELLDEGDPQLKQISESYDFEKDGDPTELVKAMVKVMFENNGIGLAAPQCGVMKRLFIMGNPDKLIVCVNPEIISGEEEVKDDEGCLSFPDLWLKVKRFKKISAKYQNLTGETIEVSLENLAARVFQHELDHLDGVCFDSKVGPTALELAKVRRQRKSR